MPAGIPNTSGAKRAPPPETKDASESPAKKPPENSAATQSPKETQAAVKNTFGDVPKSGPDSESLQASDVPKTSNSVNDARDVPVKTPDGRNVDRDEHGNPIAVNADGTPVVDPKGKPYAVDQTGQYVETEDGKYGVYDAKGRIVASDPATGEIHADQNGNPYAVRRDGKYAGVDGKEVVYHKDFDDNPVAVDAEPAFPGGPVPAVDVDKGAFIKTPDGNAVVYKKVNNKVTQVAVGNDGNPLVLEGYPAAVGKDGNYLKTPDGNGIVYDGKGNMVALGQDGKVVTDGSGNPLVVDKDGSIVPGIVYDKDTGYRIQDPANNNVRVDGRLVAVDDDGNVIMDEAGNTAVYDDMGKPVFRLDMKTPDGLQIYKDAKTGELEVSIPNGPVYKIDPATNDIATDAEGKYLPALYDPVNSDETRPSVAPNERPDTTIANLPRGKERGDPMNIKSELFDKNGYLSNENLYKALEKYDTRDVYDALINAGNAGGWANMKQSPEIIHPDENMAKQAIAALIAWQNENGKYNPIKDGKVPTIVFENRLPWKMQNENRDTNSISISINTSRPATAAAFQGLTKLKMSDVFGAVYNGSGNPSLDTVSEYLANNWTGDKGDMNGELNLKWEFRKMDYAVLQLGNGDRNAGLDRLKRAYFTGDPVAIRELNKHLFEWKDSAGQ